MARSRNASGKLVSKQCAISARLANTNTARPVLRCQRGTLYLAPLWSADGSTNGCGDARSLVGISLNTEVYRNLQFAATALTIAKMPARSAPGRLGHAFITAASSTSSEGARDGVLSTGKSPWSSPRESTFATTSCLPTSCESPAPVLKTGNAARRSGVRIPPPPL